MARSDFGVLCTWLSWIWQISWPFFFFFASSPDTAPSGPNLEYDPAFAALERAAEGRPEQAMGGVVTLAELPEWGAVLEKGVDLLGRTKDLRLAVHVTRALLHRRGVGGSVDGLASAPEVAREPVGFAPPRAGSRRQQRPDDARHGARGPHGPQRAHGAPQHASPRVTCSACGFIDIACPTAHVYLVLTPESRLTPQAFPGLYNVTLTESLLLEGIDN